MCRADQSAMGQPSTVQSVGQRPQVQYMSFGDKISLLSTSTSALHDNFLRCIKNRLGVESHPRFESKHTSGPPSCRFVEARSLGGKASHGADISSISYTTNRQRDNSSSTHSCNRSCTTKSGTTDLPPNPTSYLVKPPAEIAVELQCHQNANHCLRRHIVRLLCGLSSASR